jgi:hypothetical protein
MERSDTDPAAALVGMWRLEEAFIVDEMDRTIGPAFGKNPAGYIAYLPDGMMMTVIADADQRKLSGDRLAAPVEERAAAFSAASAYAGRYSFDGRTVVHTVEVATNPNWVGTEVVRFVEFVGAKVIYRTAPQPIDGVTSVIRLIWARHRP